MKKYITFCNHSTLKSNPAYDRKNYSNHNEVNEKLDDEKWYPPLNLKEIQWLLRRQRDQNFP